MSDVLFGDVSPSGKLPATVPRAVGQVPIYYDHKDTGRPPSDSDYYTSKYLDLPIGPLYPFGYGLSYTTFRYDGLRVSAPSMGPRDSLTVGVNVTNTGARAADEVAQLYVHQRVASITPPVRRLAGFERVSLKPGETRTLTFRLGPEQLGFWNQQMKYVVEPGSFDVYAGGSSVGGVESSFEVRPAARR